MIIYACMIDNSTDYYTDHMTADFDKALDWKNGHKYTRKIVAYVLEDISN